MHCPTHAYADVVVAAATGRIDFAGAQALEAALAPALEPGSAIRGVVVDLSRVDYISSVGLRVLMLAAKQSKSQGGAIAVVALQPVVKEIFEISKFTLVIPCFTGVRDALAELSPSALAAYGAA